MTQYHKIQTVFKRDEKTKHIIEGDYTCEAFEVLKDIEWVFTEKVDGTNIRVMWDGTSVTFGGKTDNAQMPIFLLYKLQELFEGTPNKLKLSETFHPNTDGTPLQVCMYGEGYGAKIQKGGGNYISDGVDFVLFDVKIGHWYLNREAVDGIAQKLGIKSVPIIGTGTLKDAIEMTRKGIKSQWGDFIAEGIVARPKVELLTRGGERIIAKIKHVDFY